MAGHDPSRLSPFQDRLLSWQVPHFDIFFFVPNFTYIYIATITSNMFNAMDVNIKTN